MADSSGPEGFDGVSAEVWRGWKTVLLGGFASGVAEPEGPLNRVFGRKGGRNVKVLGPGARGVFGKVNEGEVPEMVGVLPPAPGEGVVSGDVAFSLFLTCEPPVGGEGFESALLMESSVVMVDVVGGVLLVVIRASYGAVEVVKAACVECIGVGAVDSLSAEEVGMSGGMGWGKVLAAEVELHPVVRKCLEVAGQLFWGVLVEDDVILENEDVVEFVFLRVADELELGLAAAPCSGAGLPPVGELGLVSVDRIKRGDGAGLSELVLLEMVTELESPIAPGREGDDGDAFEVVGKHGGGG